MSELQPQAPKKIKLAFCIPSAGEWKADFGMSLLQMAVTIAQTLFEDRQEREVIILDKRTSLLSRSRQECIEDALLQGCTHALFVDTDQSFPPDTAHRLINWKQPVVACNIALKTMPSFPTARGKAATPFGVPVTSDSWKVGLEQVWRIGMGIMLIDLSIMEKLPKPWFMVSYDTECQMYIGEDWYFCQLLEAAGIPIYIDHGLSRQVGHHGEFRYEHQHIPQYEEQAKAA